MKRRKDSKFVPKSREADHFIVDALFSTVTNVNFDAPRFQKLLDDAKRIYKGPESNIEQAVIEKKKRTQGDDVTGLQELLMYGIKGTAAYAHHAKILGKEDDAVYDFFREALAFLADDPADVNRLIAMNLKCGEVNLRVMELLDSVHTGTYGHPVPTKVRTTPVKGKAILVSGHDLTLKAAETDGRKGRQYLHARRDTPGAWISRAQSSNILLATMAEQQDQQRFAAFPGLY